MTARRSVGIAFLAFAIAIVGCDASVLQGLDGTPFFPTERPERAGFRMAALGGGTLVLEDNCLWLRSGQERHLVIWPAGNRLERRADGVAVVDADGRKLAQVGEEVTVGGGEWRAAESDVDINLEVERMIGRGVPPACREGLYWIGGIVDE